MSRYVDRVAFASHDRQSWHAEGYQPDSRGAGDGDYCPARIAISAAALAGLSASPLARALERVSARRDIAASHLPPERPRRSAGLEQPPSGIGLARGR
jgi:hypothetical protein